MSSSLLKDALLLRQRLRDNDPTLQRLEICAWQGLVRDHHIDDFCEALQGNTAIQAVYLRSKACQQLHRSTTERLLENVLVTLPNLKHVEISSPIINDNNKCLGGAVVATLLQGVRTLQTLVLWPFAALDSRETVQQLVSAIEHHPSLQTFSLLNIKPSFRLDQRSDSSRTARSSNGTTTNNNDDTGNISMIPLDDILEALATVPNLTNLHLSPCFRINPDTQWIVRPETSLMRLLSSSSSRLKSLSIRNMGLNDDCGRSLAMALRQNTTLQHLDLRFNDFGRPSLAAILETMQYHNFTLTSLSILNHQSGAHTTNSNTGVACWPKIRFCVDLNRAGRGALVQRGLPLDACFDDFFAARDETSVIFTLLRASPQLFADDSNS